MEVSEGKQHDKITRQKLIGTHFISTHISFVKENHMAKADVRGGEGKTNSLTGEVSKYWE